MDNFSQEESAYQVLVNFNMLTIWQVHFSFNSTAACINFFRHKDKKNVTALVRVREQQLMEPINIGLHFYIIMSQVKEANLYQLNISY